MANCRNVSSTAAVRDIFNVKNEDDFKTRVMKSDIPVIVDFHAGSVIGRLILIFICGPSNSKLCLSYPV